MAAATISSFSFLSCKQTGRESHGYLKTEDLIHSLKNLEPATCGGMGLLELGVETLGANSTLIIPWSESLRVLSVVGLATKEAVTTEREISQGEA